MNNHFDTFKGRFEDQNDYNKIDFFFYLRAFR